MPSKPDICLALLRGINVSGKAQVKMAELKACFSDYLKYALDFLQKRRIMSRRIELILFDIDGTLLQSHNVTRYGLSIALKEVFGRYGPIDQYSMSGKTAQQIMRNCPRLAYGKISS